MLNFVLILLFFLPISRSSLFFLQSASTIFLFFLWALVLYSFSHIFDDLMVFKLFFSIHCPSERDQESWGKKQGSTRGRKIITLKRKSLFALILLMKTWWMMKLMPVCVYCCSSIWCFTNFTAWKLLCCVFLIFCSFFPLGLGIGIFVVHKNRDVVPLNTNEDLEESDEDIEQPVFDFEVLLLPMSSPYFFFFFK